MPKIKVNTSNIENAQTYGLFSGEIRPHSPHIIRETMEQTALER